MTEKPSWNSAPEWAKYLVQTRGGLWYWFEQYPLGRNIQIGWKALGGRSEIAGVTEPNSKWRKTLETRPNEKT